MDWRTTVEQAVKAGFKTTLTRPSRTASRWVPMTTMCSESLVKKKSAFCEISWTSIGTLWSLNPTANELRTINFT
ncbi:unnamed protein product [Cylicocyclus nassatus]|uniref:Uncharacterized protein n=1 Tax=Cylicocyclus nassatus TaxID=53992 RepID=A0AA36DSK9_CYLNA|nr:unnamed protein product [Cylicocyclus nassatus]